MLGLFKRKGPARERAIFDYHDGEGVRKADPLAVWAGLEHVTQEHGGTVKLMKDIAAKDPPPGTSEEMRMQFDARRMAAAEILSQAAGKAFGLPRFDPVTGKGLTRAECIALVGHFLNFLGGLAVAARPFASSSPQPDTSPGT